MAFISLETPAAMRATAFASLLFACACGSSPSGEGAEAGAPGGGGNAAEAGPTSGGEASAEGGLAPTGAGGDAEAMVSPDGPSTPPSTSSGDGGGVSDGGAQTGGDGGPPNPNEGPLPGTGVMVFPPPASQGICPDPPLRITFASPPTLGSSGSIHVTDASGAAVAAVDMSAMTITDTIGGVSFNLLRPVYVDGDDVVVYLKSHALAYGKTYSVTIDAGAILGPGGASLVVSGPTSWRFSTAAAAPTQLSALKVATNGSGDFCSIQGALDAVPANAAATTVTLEPGTYHEVIHASSKTNLTIQGVDRKATIVDATNNQNMNPTTSTRSVVGIDDSSHLVIDSLTVENATPQGGSQAEALRLQNCDECVVRNADILSLQDTILWSGRLYAENCYIAGNVDFVWGTGAAYFKGCELHTVGRAGAVVQARNGASGYGYVFVDSKLTADPGVTGQVLGRIDDGAYPASQVAYVNCTMGSFIAPAGWSITGVGGTSQLRFWEYESVDESGKPIDTSQRVAGSTQISAAQAMSMRDPSVVLAGWTPPP